MTRTSWQSGMKKIVLSGLWTETCVALPTVQAIYDKYEVYIAEDMIRSAVDLRVPMVAVTLLHRKVLFTRRSGANRSSALLEIRGHQHWKLQSLGL